MTFEYAHGGYMIRNEEGVMIVNQPFDPRTGELFQSEEDAREYAGIPQEDSTPTK